MINKYHLGEIEQVKWKTSNKILSIDFMTLNKEVIGNITHKDFDLEDSELSIYETKKLLNLLSITQGDLLFNLEKTKKNIDYYYQNTLDLSKTTSHNFEYENIIIKKLIDEKKVVNLTK